MRAAQFTEYSKPASKSIQVQNVATPSLSKPTDVLIKVSAVSVNPIDYKVVYGDLKPLLDLKLPQGLCFDVAGEVVEVGSSVNKFKKGDYVYARVDHDRMGTAAEYAITSEQSLALKPKELSFDQAAAIPLAGLTALQSLRDLGKLSQGEKVLILGGSGGVGSLAIQIARVLGASEIATTASKESFDLLRPLGATVLIDYKTEKFTEKIKDYDLVFDTTDQASEAFSCVKKGGRVVSVLSPMTVEGLRRGGMEVGTLAAAGITAMSAPVLAKAKLQSVDYEFCWMRPDGSELTEMAAWIDQGKICPVMDRVFTLAQTGEAFDYLAEGHAKGKVVIHVADL